MNMQCWINPPSQDIDAIESLNNEGWNWGDFTKYHKRAREQLKISVPHRWEAFDDLFSDTLSGMGLKKNDDPYSGNNMGPFVALGVCFSSDYTVYFSQICQGTIDPKTYTRSYSVNAYYLPVADRPNLTVYSLTDRFSLKVERLLGHSRCFGNSCGV